MSISPFSFRELGTSDVEFISAPRPKSFLPTGRKQEEAAPPAPPPPPPAVFSEDDVKTAERDSYQKGFLDGIVEGKKQSENTQAELEKALTECVGGWADHYEPLFKLYREMLAHQAALLPQLAYGVAKKVAGTALNENAQAHVEEICLRAIKTMMHEPKLSITIHDSMQESLEKKLAIARKTSQFAGEIQVNGDPNIAPPNCRIEWKNGAMIRDTESLWQQVEQVIASMVASGQRDAAALCDTIEASRTAPPQDGETPTVKGEENG